METRNAAVAAMLLASVTGYLLSDGELKRIQWIRAMRKCLSYMQSMIRYEKVSLETLLRRIDLRGTPQERQLTHLFHTCAKEIELNREPELEYVFASKSVSMTGYGVLSMEDRMAFEAVLGQLGRIRLTEQLRAIDQADEQLRAREEELGRESKRRAHLIRVLGFSCGAALFLILI